MTVAMDMRTAVETLVREHMEIEEGVVEIVWFKDPEERDIFFIEVNEDAFILDPPDFIAVFTFGATPDLPYRTRIADVRPEDWERVLKGEVPLPRDWDLKTAEHFARKEWVH